MYKLPSKAVHTLCMRLLMLLYVCMLILLQKLTHVCIHRHLCLAQGAYILASTCAKGAPCAANTGGLHGWAAQISLGLWLLSLPGHCLVVASIV